MHPRARSDSICIDDPRRRTGRRIRMKPVRYRPHRRELEKLVIRGEEIEVRRCGYTEGDAMNTEKDTWPGKRIIPP